MVIVASPMKSIHSSNPLFDVIITDVFSDIAEIKLKNRFASCVLSGKNPTSSITISDAFRIFFILLLLLVIICSVFKSMISYSSVVNTAAYPISNAFTVSATARCVFPMPGGPRKHMLYACSTHVISASLSMVSFVTLL